MAWGDLRHDHSDIFGSRARETIPSMRADAIGPGHTQWTMALDMASRPDGATVQEIATELGHRNPKSNTYRLLRRMLDAGAVRRARRRTDRKGPSPFAYYKA